jgi:hypothetical protein
MKKWEQLQWYVANKFRELGDKFARPTKQSGGGSENGDVISFLPWRVECKQRNTKDITVRIDTWNKNKASIPFNSHILPMLVLENKTGQKFVVLDADDFFNILKK